MTSPLPVDGARGRRLAVVTGAGSGIGAQTAATFREKGWDVLGIDLRESDGVRAADVTDEAALGALAAEFDGRRVDALACVAGIWMKDDNRYTSVSLDVWNQTFAVNVTGTMLTLRAFAPLLGEGSSVITVASMAAISGIPRRDAYTASKGAIAALTRAWAVDLIRLGIRVNSIAPGVVETPLTARVSGDDTPSLPLGRPATTAEIANLIVALGGPEFGYLNGAVIPVDGGLTAATGLVALAPR